MEALIWLPLHARNKNPDDERLLTAGALSWLGWM